jgi:uncharacterized membrane protein
MTVSQESPAKAAGDNTESLSDHIDQNIESVAALQRREWDQTGKSQRRVERISRLIGRPVFLVALLVFVALWIGVNSMLPSLGLKPVDPPPFQWLEGGLTLIALLMTTIVLIAQNRQTKLEQQHTHLDLQVNLLTEQKVTKLIHLIEELRRDLPMVKDRHDPQAAALQESPNPSAVLSAIDDVGLTHSADPAPSDGSIPGQKRPSPTR